MPHYTTTPPDERPADLIDFATARRLLGGISLQTIYRLIAAGQLDQIKIRRRSFVTRTSVETLIANGTTPEKRT